MGFGGVTLSLAGVVVLCIAIMRSDMGEVVFGRRVWRRATTMAAVVFLGIAVYERDAVVEGMDVVTAQTVERFNEVMAESGVLPATTTTTTPPPTTAAPS